MNDLLEGQPPIDSPTVKDSCLKSFERHVLGDMVACYDPIDGHKGLQFSLVPRQYVTRLMTPRRYVEDDLPEIRNRPSWMRPVRGSIPDSLIHFKLKEDDAGWGFSAGISMQQNQAVDELVFTGQTVQRLVKATRIETKLLDPKYQLSFVHRLTHTDGAPGVIVEVECQNMGKDAVHLELLNSFVLSGMSPFHEADGAHVLQLHRFRSWWSAEAKPSSVMLEQLHLIRSWSGTGLFSERFGQVGTMPVRKWFPFVALEDIPAGVTWGAQLAWPGSWQIEVTRKGDRVSLSGGLADREFGHWMKRLDPGESLISPAAYLSVVEGGLAEIGQALVRTREFTLPPTPSSEASLPVVFNEWCSSWGNPNHKNILDVARRLVGSGVKYIVIDDGWMKKDKSKPGLPAGDWLVDETRFPGGFAETNRQLRELGFIPGLWFEFEVVGLASEVIKTHSDHLLRRDGRPLRSGGRYFWNLQDPQARLHLEERVIKLLKESGFGYLKVDYNDNIGIGCDHPDSLGEGLRQQALGILGFFQRIHEEIPDLVIENCSSGGHRLEPAMMGLSAMSSFSDAHECLSIPIIARNLHHLIPPRQSQIWAVLHASDAEARIVYSLTATFLGRMCLSGPVENLTSWQMDLLNHAVAVYTLAAPAIKEGRSQFIGEGPSSYSRPSGHQGVMRISTDGNLALAVVHGFDLKAGHVFQLPLPLGKWSLVGCVIDQETHIQLVENHLTIWLPIGFHGAAVVLTKT